MADPILQRIVFQRFRSLPSEQVTFDNPTFVAGQNGSGKAISPTPSHSLRRR